MKSSHSGYSRRDVWGIMLLLSMGFWGSVTLFVFTLTR